MEAPIDSWEERRSRLTPGEAYRCWLYGEGLEAGVEKEKRSGNAGAFESNAEEGPEGPEPALPSTSILSKRRGFSKDRVEAVLKSGGKLSRADLLRCRVRWFSDGVAIGSKGFVEGVFNGCRSYFGAKRKSGARRVREDATGGLHALRELRIRSVE
jgi:hypothetical protein